MGDNARNGSSPSGSSPSGLVGDEARLLAKVRALLAKAESTTFPEEAEAFTAKAQELMARYAFDEAMVDAAGGRASGAAPFGQRVEVPNPYASAKFFLLSAIGTANRCKSVWCRDAGSATVFGYPADLTAVEILYTSLLVQATATMVGSGSQIDGWGRSRTRSFRHSFLLAYARRIGERLREAAAATEQAAVQDYGDRLLPVLLDRAAAVEQACADAFPEVKTMSVSAGNHAGWAAGREAADRASLAVHPQVRSRR